MNKKNQGYSNATTVKLQGLELEVNHKDKQIFFLERNKEARKEQLRRFIHNHLRERWLTISKAQAILERKFVQTLLDSL
jgi:hypothetical protein